MENVVHVMDHDHMLFFRSDWPAVCGPCRARKTLSPHSATCSDRGVVYSVRAYEVPEAQRTAQGTPISSVLDIPKNGSITAVQATAEFPEGESLIMATKGLLPASPSPPVPTLVCRAGCMKSHGGIGRGADKEGRAF